MRVLVVSAPFVSHTYPLVPLAWELRAAGHEVLVATAGQGLRAAEAGLPVADVSRGFDMRRTRWRFTIRNPLLARAERAGKAGTRAVVMLFGEINDELVDGVVDLARQWRPDLILHGSLAPVGAVAADLAQIPAVLCDHTFFDGQQLSYAATGHLGYAAGRHGVSTPRPPAAVLRLAPASVVGDRPGLRTRYVPYDSGWVAPDWLDNPQTPRIAVVHSTPGDGRGSLVRTVVRAAPSLAAEVVLVRPRLGAGPPLPSNVRAVEWTSLSQLLPTCSAIVHHGGTDVTLTAMAYGVPQLVVPDTGERRHNAGLVYTRGVGLVASRRTVTTALLRRLLHDDGLADAAHEVRVEMSSASDPSEVIATLAQLPV